MADNDGFGISGASFSLSGSGIVILFNNPAATGTYWAYNGANGTMRIAATLEAAIQNAGMTLTPTGYTAPAITDPALISPNYIGRLGNNAMVDAANTIAARYDLNVADIGIDLSGIQGRPQNIFTYANGNTFRPDLGAYTTQSQWSGATVHLDEVKAVQNLTGSARNLNQVQQYGRAITEINTESANMRLMGTAARNTGVALSVAGTGLDIWSNYRIADQYGWGNYQSNSSLIRSGISESGIWGTGIYGGYSAWSAAAAAGRTLAPFEVLGAGLRLSGEVAGPVMVGASLAQIGYGVYSDNWSYGPHAQHAVEDNAYELTSAGAGAGIGFVVAGPPGALVGLGIGYGVGSLAHITSNAYNDYASQFPDSGPEQWDGGMPGPTDSAPAGNSPGDGGINNGAAGNSPSDGMRLSTGLGVVGYYDPEKGAWVSLDAGPETGAPAESIPGVFQRYTPLDSLAPATSPEQVVPQGADTTSDPGAAGGSFGDTGGFGGDTGDTGGGDTGGGSSGGGSSGGSPVVLDLSGKGIKVTPLSSSNMFFDMANNGHEQRTAWAGAGNGVLVYDPSGGAVAQANQVNFTLWDPAAKTDMQALRDVFDSNHDGALNSSDTNWNDFRILVTNADGTQTLETLAQAGVTSINLNANSYKQGFTDGSSIDGETTFTRSDGTTGPAASVTLANDGGN